MTSQKKYIQALRQFEKATARLGIDWHEQAYVPDPIVQSDPAFIRDSISRLAPLYQAELVDLRMRAKKVRRRNARLFSQTTFEVMTRHELEESHSNVLAYLLENGVKGRRLLEALLSLLGTSSARQVHPLLRSTKSLSVHREYPVRGGWIDVFIDGRTWAIIIENKFHARLHQMANGIDQTEHYYREIKKLYPRKTVVGMLLQHDSDDEDNSKKGGHKDEGHFGNLDYGQLHRLLESFRPSFKNDSVFTEYLYLLRRLSFGLANNDDSDNIQDMTLSMLRTIISESKRWHSKMN